MMTTKTVTLGDGGWRAEFYTDDDGGSGWGDNAMVGYWYGTREECEAATIDMVEMHPMEIDDRPDPFDLACERKFD